MRYFIIVLFIAIAPSSLIANSGGHLERANIDIYDQESLQHGAQLFVNYCQGCHSLKYQRYSRLAKDIGLSKAETMQNLIFNGSKVTDHMTTSMTASQGEAWFGKAPPDLTLKARARGVDWLYTYLKSFYVDSSRPFGVNNTLFPSVGMPHVLAGLQGIQSAEFEKHEDGAVHFKHFKMETAGSLSAEEYDTAVRDLVNFLAYVAEPIKRERQKLGIYVLIFLAFFFGLTYMLKKEYWKDIH